MAQALRGVAPTTPVAHRRTRAARTARAHRFARTWVAVRCGSEQEPAMPYPLATPAQVQFFAEHGWLAVDDAIDPADLAHLAQCCDVIIAKKERMAYDWAWSANRARDEREFLIVQSSPSLFFPELAAARYRAWAVAFGATLLGQPMEFWYEQFLGKPPGVGATTPWHQDEAYWGRNLDGRGVTCWMPLHDVDAGNGCMHFTDGGHLDGVLPHRQPPGVQSDLLTCTVDEARTVACPLRLGGVTFHHGKTPHMTTSNGSPAWRRILTQHLRVAGTDGEGDHYPWKVFVDQRTGERTVPPTR
jgi:ectoine hydroxylase-related dioxygenase (phytanoyl-CoA dioxygenase family)